MPELVPPEGKELEHFQLCANIGQHDPVRRFFGWLDTEADRMAREAIMEMNEVRLRQLQGGAQVLVQLVEMIRFAPQAVQSMLGASDE